MKRSEVPNDDLATQVIMMNKDTGTLEKWGGEPLDSSVKIRINGKEAYLQYAEESEHEGELVRIWTAKVDDLYYGLAEYLPLSTPRMN
jgi:hypothetical protein